jgi:hypothetical protein
MNDVTIKRFCSAGYHEVIDDGKGVLKKSNDNGARRWQCSICTEHQKNNTFRIVAKGKVGRKPNPREDYSLCDPFEDREFIKRELGI